jgi:hypothetical protein
VAWPALFAAYPYRRTIGTRDLESVGQLTRLGLKAKLIGCATLTLPRYGGPRESYAVSVDSPAPADIVLSHVIPPEMSWQEQWKRGLKYLAVYRKARIVYTSRLHVLLPCLAMGTPVVYTADHRFSILGSQGLAHAVQFDPSALRKTYLGFLEDAVGRPLVEHDPIFPSPAPDADGNSTVDTLQG